MKPERQLGGIYALTDPGLTPAEQLLPAVEQALLGGIHLLQYRDKHASNTERRQRAQALQALCKQYDVPLIINDDVELALAVNAAGVHLGREDMSLTEARAALGADAIIGVSCYNQLQRAIEAAEHGADYVAFGSVYPSPTKPHAVRANPDLLLQAKRALTIPVCAIGGIDTGNAQALLACGIDLLAVISGIFAQNDIKSATRELVECWLNSQKQRIRPRGARG